VAKKKPPLLLPHRLLLLHLHRLLTHLHPLLLLTQPLHLLLLLPLPLAKRSNSFFSSQKSHPRVAFLCLNRAP
jgi:hypothetical protein